MAKTFHGSDVAFRMYVGEEVVRAAYVGAVKVYPVGDEFGFKGALASDSSVIATLKAQRKLAALIASLSSVAPRMSVGRKLVVTDASISSQTSAMKRARRLTVVDASISAATIALKRARALATSIAALSAATVALSIGGQVALATALASISAVTVALKRLRSIAVSDASVSSHAAAFARAVRMIVADASISSQASVLKRVRNMIVADASISAATIALKRLRSFAVADASISAVTVALTTVSASAFPIIQATSSTNITSTTIQVPKPTGTSTGDMLLVVVGKNGAAGLLSSAASGFTVVKSLGSEDPDVIVYYKIADGSEGSTFDFTFSDNTKLGGIAYRISGAHASTAPAISTTSAATTTNPNPPSLSPSWGSAKTLWIAVAAEDDGTISAYPTNYSLSQKDDGIAGASGIRLAMAGYQLEAASDDPGTFTFSSNRPSVAFTLAVRPA